MEDIEWNSTSSMFEPTASGTAPDGSPKSSGGWNVETSSASPPANACSVTLRNGDVDTVVVVEIDIVEESDRPDHSASHDAPASSAPTASATTTTSGSVTTESNLPAPPSTIPSTRSQSSSLVSFIPSQSNLSASSSASSASRPSAPSYIPPIRSELSNSSSVSSESSSSVGPSTQSEYSVAVVSPGYGMGTPKPSSTPHRIIVEVSPSNLTFGPQAIRAAKGTELWFTTTGPGFFLQEEQNQTTPTCRARLETNTYGFNALRLVPGEGSYNDYLHHGQCRVAKYVVPDTRPHHLFCWNSHARDVPCSRARIFSLNPNSTGVAHNASMFGTKFGSTAGFSVMTKGGINASVPFTSSDVREAVGGGLRVALLLDLFFLAALFVLA